MSYQQFLLFKNLCLIDTSFAEKKHYDYALILGATLSRVRSRFHFLIKEWEKGVRFDQLVILTGDRPLNPIFENKESLMNSPYPTRAQWICPEELPKNETEMCLFVYNQMAFPEEFLNKKLVVIDTPQKKGLRPTTKDTFIYWLKDKPVAGKALIISDQPFLPRAHILSHKMLPDFNIDGRRGSSL